MPSLAPPTQPNLFGVPQSAPTSDDYYTPQWIFDAMRLEFDLDVAAPPGGIPWIPAKRFFTMKDDGLAQDWEGVVWMNPPYSRATPWVDKFIAHRSGVALLPHAKSAWHAKIMAKADGIAAPDRYFNFVPAGGGNGSILMPVFFAAFGDHCVNAISALGSLRVLAS